MHQQGGRRNCFKFRHTTNILILLRTVGTVSPPSSLRPFILLSVIERSLRIFSTLPFSHPLQVATRIMKQMIEQFAACDLFGRANYEYYARVTGRVLRVQDEWICSFRYPPPPRGKTAQQNYACELFARVSVLFSFVFFLIIVFNLSVRFVFDLFKQLFVNFCFSFLYILSFI